MWGLTVFLRSPLRPLCGRLWALGGFRVKALCVAELPLEFGAVTLQISDKFPVGVRTLSAHPFQCAVAAFEQSAKPLAVILHGTDLPGKRLTKTERGRSTPPPLLRPA